MLALSANVFMYIYIYIYIYMHVCYIFLCSRKGPVQNLSKKLKGTFATARKKMLERSSLYTTRFWRRRSISNQLTGSGPK